MATEFQMPKFGLTMEEGTIIEWLVGDDAEVAEGTPVVRIETDKVETEVESSGTGRLHHIGQPGKAFACGDVIAMFLAPGESPRQSPRRQRARLRRRAAPAVPSRPWPGRIVPPRRPRPELPTGASSPPRMRSASLPTRARHRSNLGAPGRVAASWLTMSPQRSVRASPPRLCRSRRLPAVRTSSPAWPPAISPICSASTSPWCPMTRSSTGSLATRWRCHVRQRLAGPVTFASSAPAPAEPVAVEPAAVDLAPTSQPPTSVVRMSGMRGTIAKRMHASLREMAQLTLSMDADLDAVVADRARRKQAGATIGFTDYVVAAAARRSASIRTSTPRSPTTASPCCPISTSGWPSRSMTGLMVPVVRHADRLDLATLSVETTRLADAARTGSLKLERARGRHLLGQRARNVRCRHVHTGDQPAERCDPWCRSAPRRRHRRRRCPSRRPSGSPSA